MTAGLLGAISLAACLADLLAAGAERVAIVGADTPHLPAAGYRRAFALLEQADVVLGPALDGGYYLVAAKLPRPELFVGIPMGTEAVLAETLARAARGGLVVALLPPLRDLDRVEDLAPDGRLIVIDTDLGSGKDDGAVTAVDVANGEETVLIDELPSTSNSGQSHADLAGPSGAAMAADGIVCAAIGSATRQDPRFATLRCTDGLVVDIEAFQARSRLPSNPYDVVWDGRDGWYVSDGAANNVLHVDRAGKVAVIARFPSLAASGLGHRDGQGVPTGLTLGPDRTLYVALFGGAPFDGAPAAVVALAPDAAIRPGTVKPKLVALLQHPIALALTPDGLAVAVSAYPAGLSARVAVSCCSRPSRMTVRVTRSPGRCWRSSPKRSSTVSTGLSSRRTITSPGRRPALAAGVPSPTSMTRTPAVWSRPSWAATSGVTWAGSMPR